MKDWKTTFIGALLAVIIAIQPIVSTGVVNWNAVGLSALVALLGYIAADKKKTV